MHKKCTREEASKNRKQKVKTKRKIIWDQHGVYLFTITKKSKKTNSLKLDFFVKQIPFLIIYGF